MKYVEINLILGILQAQPTESKQIWGWHHKKQMQGVKEILHSASRQFGDNFDTTS